MLIIVALRGVILRRACIAAGRIGASAVVLRAVGVPFRYHNHPNAITTAVRLPTALAVPTEYLTVIVCICTATTAWCSMGNLRIRGGFLL